MAHFNYFASKGQLTKKATSQPATKKRAKKGSPEEPTHKKKLLSNHLLKKVVLKGQLTTKKLLPNHLLKKVVLKCQLTKKATSQPATKKRAKYKGPTHKKSFFTTIYLKK